MSRIRSLRISKTESATGAADLFGFIGIIVGRAWPAALVRAALDHLHIPAKKLAYSSQLSESGEEFAKSISPCFLGTR